MRIVSDYRVHPDVEVNDISLNELKNAPMMYSARDDYAWNYGGRLTRRFLEAVYMKLPNDGLIVDSRVHMLMPGWYPAIPGWHLDDIPRLPRTGQPNHLTPSYEAHHMCMIVDMGTGSLTEFLSGTVALCGMMYSSITLQWASVNK